MKNSLLVFVFVFVIQMVFVMEPCNSIATSPAEVVALVREGMKVREEYVTESGIQATFTIEYHCDPELYERDMASVTESDEPGIETVVFPRERLIEVEYAIDGERKIFGQRVFPLGEKTLLGETKGVYDGEILATYDNDGMSVGIRPLEYKDTFLSFFDLKEQLALGKNPFTGSERLRWYETLGQIEVTERTGNEGEVLFHLFCTGSDSRDIGNMTLLVDPNKGCAILEYAIFEIDGTLRRSVKNVELSEVESGIWIPMKLDLKELDGLKKVSIKTIEFSPGGLSDSVFAFKPKSGALVNDYRDGVSFTAP